MYFSFLKNKHVSSTIWYIVSKKRVLYLQLLTILEIYLTFLLLGNYNIMLKSVRKLCPPFRTKLIIRIYFSSRKKSDKFIKVVNTCYYKTLFSLYCFSINYTSSIEIFTKSPMRWCKKMTIFKITNDTLFFEIEQKDLPHETRSMRQSHVSLCQNLKTSTTYHEIFVLPR